MYFYLYDIFVLDKKFESQLTKVEHRLIELGINGQIGKLSVLKNMEQMMGDAIKQGAENIIVVGDDKTLSRAIKFLAKEKVTLGYIPFDPKSRYAEALGITSPENAVDILSRRIVEKIDIGRINNSIYFLTSVEIDVSEGNITIECDKKYTITPEKKIDHISICNFGDIISSKSIGKSILSNPRDSMLEIMLFSNIKNKKVDNTDTILPIKKLRIESGASQIPLYVDGEVVAKTPATVEIAPQKTKLIVGKKRMF